MQRTKILLMFGFLCAGCPSDDGGMEDNSSSGSSTTAGTSMTTSSGTNSTGVGSSSMTSASSVGSTGDDLTGGQMPTTPPALGPQLDRVGRPLVSTALLERWFVPDGDHDTAVDSYNEDDAVAGWSDTYWSRLHLALGVFDSLDNQSRNTLQYDTGGPSPCHNTSVRDCYQTVALLFANDWILVRGNTNQPVEYLGIEEDILGVTGPSNPRGGRRPDDDVVDRTYSLLANTALTDNVNAPPQAQVGEFPFLAPPN